MTCSFEKPLRPIPLFVSPPPPFWYHAAVRGCGGWGVTLNNGSGGAVSMWVILPSFLQYMLATGNCRKWRICRPRLCVRRSAHGHRWLTQAWNRQKRWTHNVLSTVCLRFKVKFLSKVIKILFCILIIFKVSIFFIWLYHLWMDMLSFNYPTKWVTSSI